MAKFRDILAHVAPTLATALGGPFAGIAAKFIANKLGHDTVPTGSKLDEFLENLLGDTENLQKIKEIEEQFKLEMEKLNVDVFSLEVDDRKSARLLAQRDNRPQIILSTAFILAYFALLAGIFWAEISPNFNPGMAFVDGEWTEDRESLIDLFQVLLGVLTAGVAQILNFWFGGLKERTG